MKEKIINLLKSQTGYISGQDLSDNLKISRAAIWKHISELREADYEISAVPHLGYKLDLVPDRLFPHEIYHNLKTKIIGKKIYHLETAVSTMDIAYKLAQEGAFEGTIVCAETQTKGRGRLLRSWNSPKYKGIYFSLILRPNISAQEASKLTLITALSICEAIKEATGLNTKIKWPNDIMLEGKKIAGILTEMQAEQDRIHFVVVGVGLNVNTKKEELPDFAASIKEFSGTHICRIELLKAILRKIESNYINFKNKGFKNILEKSKSISFTIGRHIKVNSQNKTIEGQALDIDLDGSLVIRKEEGILEKVFSGDVVTLR